MGSQTLEAIEKALMEPFDPTEVKWKPGAVKGNRAMALCYVDARVIQDRLDQVVGVLGWQDAYECLPDGCVVCTLSIKIGEEWISKVDVGGASEQPDEGDRRKAAFSDALKRAAVKFGIGRYLYRLGSQWCDYDPKSRRFAKVPALPAWAIPQSSRQKSTTASQPANAKKTTRKTEKVSTPPPQELDRPYDQDQDQAELIEKDHAMYLVQEARKAGMDQAAILKRLGVAKFSDVSFGTYREMLDSFHTAAAR